MHRKRLERHEHTGDAHFLTFSCFHRLPLFNNDAIKQRFVDRMTASLTKTQVWLLAWVIMPEHVHLVVQPSEGATVAAFLHDLKKPFAAEVLRRSRTLNAGILPSLETRDGHSFWQPGGGHDRDVWEKELIEKIAYTHFDPVVRGLVRQTIDYRWSSARAFEGLDNAGPPIEFDAIPPTKRPLT